MADNVDKYQKIGEELIKRHVDFVPFTQVIQRAIDELNATTPEDVVSFGYTWLDDKLTGLFKGELVVIGGETGTGKTTFATNIVYKASKHHKCAVFALEDRLNDYGIKALYFEIGLLRKKDGKKNYPWNDYRKNVITDASYKSYLELAQKSLENDNVFFGEVKKQMDVEMLEAAMEDQIEKGTKLFLIDHLHYFDLLKGDASKADYVESVMVKLKGIQNRTGARVLLVVHYKKLNGAKPTIDAFKDSISIPQNANYVINLWRDRTLKDGEELFEDRYQTKIFVPKSRNPNGEFTIDVTFNPEINDYDSPKVSYGTPEEKQESQEVIF